MPHTHDTSFLARTHALDGGARVRLRLARRSDVPAARRLLRECGVDATELELRRALAYDPAERRVYCALTSVGGRETLAGLGAIELKPGAEIDMLVVDEAAAPGLGQLLGVLLQALAAPRRRAA